LSGRRVHMVDRGGVVIEDVLYGGECCVVILLF